MSEPIHSRRTAVFLLSVALAGCTAATTPAPRPQPAPLPQPAVTAPSNPDQSAMPVPRFPFTSRGEHVLSDIEQYEKEVRCIRGNNSKGAPIICVDNSTVRPNPYYAHVWDMEGLNGKPTTQAVTIHWFTRRAGELQINFQPAANNKACVTQPVCHGGHCVAKVEPLDRGEKSRTCRYNVWVDGQILDKESPELAVNPCCW